MCGGWLLGALAFMGAVALAAAAFALGVWLFDRTMGAGNGRVVRRNARAVRARGRGVDCCAGVRIRHNSDAVPLLSLFFRRAGQTDTATLGGRS